MDLYRCDYTLQPVEIVDDYESLIWTDRYVGAGDFKLVVKENHMLAWVTGPTFLQCSESNRMMMIETVNVKRQEAGQGQSNMMEITGRGVEAFLTMRNNKGLSYGINPESFSGTVGSIGKQLVDKYCINSATAGPANVIPNLVSVNFYGTATTTATFERGPIYEQLTSLALAYGAGWMFHMNTPGKMTFCMYDGIDKTSPTYSYYRVYSADDDSLFNTSSIQSSANFKNHARVIGKTIGVDVYAAGYTSAITGMDRRTLVVEARDVDDVASLTNVGKRALADDANRLVNMVDGDIPTVNWNDIYYGLGDIVWVKDTYGLKVKSRITEEILSSDASNGFARVPTFDMV